MTYIGPGPPARPVSSVPLARHGPILGNDVWVQSGISCHDVNHMFLLLFVYVTYVHALYAYDNICALYSDIICDMICIQHSICGVWTSVSDCVSCDMFQAFEQHRNLRTKTS